MLVIIPPVVGNLEAVLVIVIIAAVVIVMMMAAAPLEALMLLVVIVIALVAAATTIVPLPVTFWNFILELLQQVGRWHFLRVDQLEVDFFLFDINAQELYLNRLADSECPLGPAPNQSHLLFQEDVVVICQFADVDQTFNRIRQLDKHTELSNRTDNCIEGFANMVCHVFGLLHAVDIPFRVDPPPFSNGGVFGNLR